MGAAANGRADGVGWACRLLSRTLAQAFVDSTLRCSMQMSYENRPFKREYRGAGEFVAD